MYNILSVDVEEWFHPEAVQHLFPREKWDECESRIEKNVENLLNLFQLHNTKATFFILGWIAEKYPAMIKNIAEAGHEIASHGYNHLMITKMNEVGFQNDLRKSIEILENTSGKKICGYRAPTFSIVDDTKWAWQILENNGFLYDSSVYPVFHDRYGIPDAPRTQFLPLQNPGTIIEFPLSTLKILGKNLPFGGGGYLRIFPLWFTTMAFRNLNRQNIPGILFVHPWEFDSDQPKIPLNVISRWRHYFNIKNNMEKLHHLLQDFKWTAFENILSQQN